MQGQRAGASKMMHRHRSESQAAQSESLKACGADCEQGEELEPVYHCPAPQDRTRGVREARSCL
jgi:hypothetical protein